MKVREIMTTKIITIKKNENVRTAVLKLRNAGVSGMPVLDDGQVIGVFSEEDLLSQFPDILMDADQIPMIDVQELTSTLVEFSMGKPAIICSPDDDIKVVASVFLEKHIHRLPVVDDSGLVGVVSLGDVLKAFIQ